LFEHAGERAGLQFAVVGEDAAAGTASHTM
jgi:hypothetical protein